MHVKHHERPLFYEYTAHYDRGNGGENEVAMGFTRQDEEACGRCNGVSIVRSQSLIATDARAKVGLKSLNTLTHPPVVRNLTGVKFLWAAYHLLPTALGLNSKARSQLS